MTRIEDAQALATLVHAPAPNLLPEEIKALEALSCRQDIVIKPANKDSVVQIMDRPQYVQEALRKLWEGVFYSKLMTPILWILWFSRVLFSGIQ